MRNVILFLILVHTFTAYPQSFRGQTSDIRVEFSNPDIHTTIPFIRWIAPQLEYTNSPENQLTIEAEVISEEALTSIQFSVTGGDQMPRTKKIEIDGDVRTKKIHQPLTLTDGQYEVKIVVVNKTGGQATGVRSILVGKDAIADAISIDRKDYAILFATDKYDHWADLVNPVEDAHAIARELKERYNFETEVVENPTHEDVFIKISEYVQKKFRPQDQLMIFFAGHGYFDDAFGEGFVVAKNSLENDQAKTTYISHSRLRSVINNIPCEHIFLAMDVCFGGTFDPVIARERGRGVYEEASKTEYLVRKLSYKTRKYLTSGGKTYVSDGIPGKHSPFALKLLQALKGSGGSDRILTLDEIKGYVEKLIPEPRSGSFGEDEPSSDFVFVARNQ